MPTPNADDPLRTTDHAPAPNPETPAETGTYASRPAPAGRDASALLADETTVTFHRMQEESRGGSPAAPSDPPPAIPGYEIEGVLGRGGMGVVYKARHLALKRTVALKMVRAGGHADPRELARFRIEAEAAARLQHPNIVQIHEVGESGPRPYCALEFVGGGNLAGKIGGKPMPAREAARLVETLARAMQLAHSRNVAHRDLKPANVLLAADGTPKITDFGLARRLDSDSGQTQAGQVMGTPSYMAPEQASGAAHDAGPAADGYALGAILYECLTGRPPFKGKTVVETLDQVRTQEPVPPSRGQTGVPLDLETICLKCLRKEPERRYPSAAELADDLGRFLRGEPVLARPVGRWERGWRWCRRNPWLASAAATVVGVLLLASVVSALFGIDARNKEAAAVSARNDLAKKNTELEQSQAVIVGKDTEIVKKNTELEQSREQLEGALARTWLSPLAEAPGPLTDTEIGAFTELAVGNDRLAERFITEALGSRQGMRKLWARSAFAWQAVVGLDARKRQEIETRLVRALEAPDLAEESRADVALAASALGELTPPAAAAVAETLLHALRSTNDPNALWDLASGLSAAAARLEPEEAARVSAGAAAVLTQAITRTNDSFALQSLAQGLSAVANRLEPTEAGEAAAAITRAMTTTSNTGALLSLGQGLSAVAARMEPREAAATITQAMAQTNRSIALEPLSRGLTAAAARLGPREAAEAAATITQAMASAKNHSLALQYLTPGLSAAADRLEPKDAAEAAAKFMQAMARTNDGNALQSLAQGLRSVAARMEPREAAAVLAQVMDGISEPLALWQLARGLSAAADRLEPEEAARVSAGAAATLTRAMARTNDPNALGDLAQALWLASAYLGSKEAAEAAAVLSQAMSRTNDPNALGPLAYGLSAAAVRLEPEEAARVSAGAAATLTRAMTRTNDPIALATLGKGLKAPAALLGSEEAARVSAGAAAVLTQAMARTNDPNALYSLTQGLSAVADRLEPREAGEAAAAITRAMTTTSNTGALLSLGQGLSAVAARLEAKEAGEAAAALTQAMARTNDPNALGSLAGGLAAVADRLEPEEAARVSAGAAAVLTQAIARTNDPTALGSLVGGLSRVTAHLGPKEAAEVTAALVQAMARTNGYALRDLAWGLSAAAARVEPEEAARVSAGAAATLTRAMARTNDPSVFTVLAQNLSAILGDGRRRERARVVAAAVGSLHESQGLPGAVALLEPAAEPFPRRLSDQQLVNLLKGPLCVGPARRAVLDHLEFRYGRPFADQWDFVRFAEEQKFGLDFTSPPKGR